MQTNTASTFDSSFDGRNLSFFLFLVSFLVNFALSALSSEKWLYFWLIYQQIP